MEWSRTFFEIGWCKKEFENSDENKTHRVEQKISELEEKAPSKRTRIKELKEKSKKTSLQKPVTEYLQTEKEEDEIDLGLFLFLGEEDKRVDNQTPVNTFIRDTENLRIGYFTNGIYILGDDGEIEINRFFPYISELAQFKDKILDKHDNDPSSNYTGILYRFWKKCKPVNRSNHGRGANAVNNFYEYEGENCFIPRGNASYVKCKNPIFKEDFPKKYFEAIQPIKQELMLWLDVDYQKSAKEIK